MKGQTLIEVLVAFGVAITIVSAITVSVLFALSNTQFSKNQHLATQYAQQGMEVIRQKRNNGETFAETTQCLVIGTTQITAKTGLWCPAGQNIPFLREVAFSNDSADNCGQTQQVEVAVFWADNKCTSETDPYCHKVHLISCLSDLYRVATPGNISVPPSFTPSPTPTPVPPVLTLSFPPYVRLSWTPTSGATGYNVYGCNGSGCNPDGIYYANVPGTTVDHPTGTGCETYFSYRVRGIMPWGGLTSPSNRVDYYSGACVGGDDT